MQLSWHKCEDGQSNGSWRPTDNMIILINSIDGNSIQCKLCTGRFRMYYCTSISTECVRIYDTPTIREIKVFSCGMKMMTAVEWGGQDLIIRDRNNNICIGEYIFYNPTPLYELENRKPPWENGEPRDKNSK